MTRELIDMYDSEKEKIEEAYKTRTSKLSDGDKDWTTPCQNCDGLPTVHPTQLCGPCCFGEADTVGGNW